MKFPDSPRVRYSRNPLVEVICQLRFPRILRIETEVPVEFQEAVRSEYPNLTSRPFDLPFLADSQSDSPPNILRQNLTYEFFDKAGKWKLVLSSDFIALSTLNYKQWEDFRNRLTTAINVLSRCYAPSYFSRIGLRYQDLIIRSELGLENYSWRDLLNPSILGIFSTDNFSEDDFSEAISLFVCRLDQENITANVRVRHGLAQKGESSELGYLIDADFYTDMTDMEDTKDVINYFNFFNRQSGNFFRWCITEKLHEALQPDPIRD